LLHDIDGNFADTLFTNSQQKSGSHMGEFTKQVRTGDIAGPLRRAFTAERWLRAFTSARDADLLDHETYAIGLAIHGKLEAIRGVLKFSSSEELSATTKLRAFLSIANRDLFVTRDKTKLAMDEFKRENEHELDEVYALEEMTAVKVTLPDGFDWSPNDVIEGLVDGIELPIRVVLQSNPSLAGNPRMNQIRWTEPSRELNLGILYRFTEDVWNDCLWNSYRMIDEGQGKIFMPEDVDALRAHRIGVARRASLTTGFSILSAQFLREALAEGAKLKVREVCAIERHGKRQVLKIAKHCNLTGAIAEISALKAHASEPYYGDLLEERLESLGGLTLSALIDSWTVISSAAHVLIQSIDEKHADIEKSRSAHARLSEYAATLQIDALVDALTNAAGINKLEGRRIVEFFTFRGLPGQEIWAQPLVPVGPDTLAPVFAAVTTPNLRRLVDVWMRQAGVDLSKRGPAFEGYVRELVADSIRRSKILSPFARCIESDYTFTPTGGRGEQFDLVFSIGNTLFVAEAKCIVEPTDGKSIALHRKTVLGAAEQVLRKAKSVEDNRTEFIASVRRFDVLLTHDFQVKPLVIVSTTTHVGIPANSVPVIDVLILERFLYGEIEDIAYQPGDPASSKKLKTLFYSNANEAENCAPDYFQSPPQLQRFVEGTRNRAVPIHAVDDKDWTAYFVTMDCVAGGVPLALKGKASPTKVQS
jgi:hypothetical protein